MIDNNVDRSIDDYDDDGDFMKGWRREANYKP